MKNKRKQNKKPTQPKTIYSQTKIGFTANCYTNVTQKDLTKDKKYGII